MKTISIVNHKGGVGKSTISTTIAGYFSNNENNKTVLGDFDMQQSSANWLNIRPDNVSKIFPWKIENAQLTNLDSDVTHLILDTPAGIFGENLDRIVSISDKIIVPLKPSVFDILSTQNFLELIIESINKQDKNIDLCLIGSMTDIRTKSTEQLMYFIKKCGLDSPTNIKQAQIYVQLAAHGITIFDSKSNIFEKEIEQWNPLIKWIEQ